MSVTNETVFFMKADVKQETNYDDFFLIFGNSELRLKSGVAKIFSNLGINKGFFDAHNESVDILFGEGKVREADLISYEIFEVFFDDEPITKNDIYNI